MGKIGEIYPGVYQHHALRAVNEHLAKGTLQHGATTSRFKLTESGHEYWKQYNKKSKRKSVPIRRSSVVQQVVQKPKRKSGPSRVATRAVPAVKPNEKKRIKRKSVPAKKVMKAVAKKKRSSVPVKK